MPCETDRPLTQTERAAGFRQQRTGVPQAVRPYMGPIPPGMQALIDYLNRELIPAVRQTRNAVNEVYLPAVDNAPSANPLGYYFSTETAAADPTAGRLRLDQAVQNTSTTLLVSEENGRLQDVGVFLDIMAGSATVPLGVVTLVDSINPGRYIRFDLNAITDQGAYWELDVDPTESSHDNPFVDGEAVILAFMPGVGSTPATVPIDALEPALSGAAGDGLTWDAINQEFDVVGSTSIIVGLDSVNRAALTGAIAAAQNSNATVFSGIRDNGATENDRTNLNFVSSTSATAVVTDDAGNDELEVTYQRAALTGVIDAAANSNATTSAEPFITYSASANMSAERVATSSTTVTVSTGVASQVEWQRAALTGAIAATANSNATLFSGIRDNGAAETDRGNLNFVSSTSATAVVTDDAANDELEVTYQRAALTGAIAASANSNATLFSGILDNGAAETDRTNLNFVSTGGVTMTVTDDAGNDELEVSAALAMPIAGAVAMLYNFDTSTTMADPGAGDVRLNNAAPASATVMAIDDTNDGGLGIGTNSLFNEFTISSGQDSANVCFITIVSRTTPTKWASYFSSTGGNDLTGYWEFALTHIASSGGAFTAAESVALLFTPVAPTRRVLAATQTQQETSLNGDTFQPSVVTPVNQHWHRSAAKAWGRLLTNGTVQETYNITSISDTGTGDVTITIATDFSGSGTYCQLATNSAPSGSEVFTYVNNATIGTGTTQLLCSAHDGTATDPSSYYWVAFGDQA